MAYSRVNFYPTAGSTARLQSALNFYMHATFISQRCSHTIRKTLQLMTPLDIAPCTVLSNDSRSIYSTSCNADPAITQRQMTQKRHKTVRRVALRQENEGTKCVAKFNNSSLLRYISHTSLGTAHLVTKHSSSP